ncbi:hypothetical protein GCM10028856_38000 [Halopiger thermotolerans]
MAGVSECVQTRVGDGIRDQNLHARDNQFERVNPSVVSATGKNYLAADSIDAESSYDSGERRFAFPTASRAMSDE